MLQEGKKFTSTVKDIGGSLKDNVWDKDYSEHHRCIAAHGKSLMRFSNANYRKSISEIRKSLIIKFTATCEEKLLLIDRVMIGQKALRFIRQNEIIA